MDFAVPPVSQQPSPNGSNIRFMAILSLHLHFIKPLWTGLPGATSGPSRTDWLVVTSGVVPALALSVLAFTEPGEASLSNPLFTALLPRR